MPIPAYNHIKYINIEKELLKPYDQVSISQRWIFCHLVNKQPGSRQLQGTHQAFVNPILQELKKHSKMKFKTFVSELKSQR